ncbi:hypothetical protein ACODT5_46470 [Streptomyces sp. 5.8]|uniref:hypothetical protein n=1 Tax=Streptomyces sp. 5.8 TaxID=3406571 RepID=UPI003BB5F7CD
MRRTWLAGTVLVAAVLAGCSPPTLDLAGVSKDAQGLPQLELTLCKGDVAGSFVYFSARGTAVSGWHTGLGADLGRPGPFPPFSPPEDWEITREGQQSLTADEYYVSYKAVEGDNVEYSVRSHFRTEDIEALGPDQVWANGKAMSRKKYRAYVKDEC